MRGAAPAYVKACLKVCPNAALAAGVMADRLIWGCSIAAVPGSQGGNKIEYNISKHEQLKRHYAVVDNARSVDA